MKPLIPAASYIKEWTKRSLFTGLLLGLLFAIANTYLGLKVGMTVSASIPSAVIALALFKSFSKKGTVLEMNLVQTIASVGEGIASGVIFTIPALFILGEQVALWRTVLLGILGGVLGILFMIPMRRYIIVREHKVLPFPEGTACAQILKDSTSLQKGGFLAFKAFLAAIFFRLGSAIFSLWKQEVAISFPFLPKAIFSIECSPAILGVGTLIGYRISSIMLAGSLLAWAVLVPLISLFLDFPIQHAYGHIEMDGQEIWSKYLRYIGIGAVGVGGIFSLIKTLPLVWETVHSSIKELFSASRNGENSKRTEKDIPLRWLVWGSLAIILILYLTPSLGFNLTTILILVALGFFFVIVTSLTVGLVGSTSSPISGMTLATLLVTCAIFVSLGWTERVYLISALTMSVVVNVSISLAGTTSQDLKTGYLLGATPFFQQVGELVGVVLPAIGVAFTLLALQQIAPFGSKILPAPQGAMMALVAQGVMEKNLPVLLVFLGAILGCIVALLRIPILPFALGIYLPFSLTSTLFLGGILHFFFSKGLEGKKRTKRSLLISSGLVAGDGCTGVLVAALTGLGFVKINSTSLLSSFSSFLLFILFTTAVFLSIMGLTKSAK